MYPADFARAQLSSPEFQYQDSFWTPKNAYDNDWEESKDETEYIICNCKLMGKFIPFTQPFRKFNKRIYSGVGETTIES